MASRPFRSPFARLATTAAMTALPLCATLLHMPAAYAQDASAMTEEERKNTARTLGEEGQKALDAKDYPRAEQLFRDATNLFGAATLTLGLARAQAAQNKVVGAAENYNKIIREWGNNPSPPPAFKAALDSAKAEVVDVEKKIASATIVLEGPPGAKVSLDGKPFPNSLLGIKRQVDPGKHVVKATADGYKAAEANFSVDSAGSADVKLAMEKDPNAGAAVVVPPPNGANPDPQQPKPTTTDDKKGSSQKTYALVAWGVGGAGLILGSVGGFMALSKRSTLKTACPNNVCQPSSQKDIDSYKTAGTLSTVGFIVAGVGGAAGAVLWFTAPGAEKKGYLSPYVGAGDVGVTGAF